MKSVVVLLLSFLLLLSCGSLGPSPEAKALAERSFELRKSGQTEHLLTLYSPAFFESTSAEEWKTMLERTVEKLGPLESYVLRNTHTFSYQGTSNSGTTTTMIYDVKYAKHPAIETLVIFQPNGGVPLIKGHNFQSAGFLD